MMIQMDDAQLADVHGQAYVLTVGERELSFKGLAERDFNRRIERVISLLGRIDLDGRADSFVGKHPGAVSLFRDGTVFAVTGVLGQISQRLPIDLPPIEFRFAP